MTAALKQTIDREPTSRFELEMPHHFIGGERVDVTAGRFGDVFDPATGEVRARVPLAARAEVNVAIAAAQAAYHSFGRWKNSLFGDHHMHGPEGVRFFTKLKTITSRWPESGPSEARLLMPTLS